MANKSLFKSTRGRKVNKTDTTNAAGGAAYKMGSKEALARYAVTGCMRNTYYTSAKEQLNDVIDLAKECDSTFVAKLAIYSRKKSFMKDMPAVLLAIIASRDDEISNKVLKAAFPKVIDNGKMLKNFVQVIRSGQFGRKSLGHGPRNLVRDFLAKDNTTWLYRQLSVGQSPSGSDIIKMVHPKPKTPEHEALMGYLIGKVKPGSEKWDNVPDIVKQVEDHKAGKTKEAPKVDFQLLTNKKMSGKEWAEVLRNGQWHFIRMNLNTAIRHGAFKADKELAKFIAKRLTDKESIQKARVMPYQLMAAYNYVEPGTPRVIINALHDAMEIAVENTPVIEGNNVIVVDVSGSMIDPITGQLFNTSSKIRCIDVAALFTAAVVKRNPDTRVLPVDTRVHPYKTEPRNTIITEAQRLAKFGGGGTNLGLAFEFLCHNRIKVDNVIVISDMESWVNSGNTRYPNPWGGTTSMAHWEMVHSYNRNSKLVCINIVPGKASQIDDKNKDDILQISGWNDAVFSVIEGFLSGDTQDWVDIISNTPLDIK